MRNFGPSGGALSRRASYRLIEENDIPQVLSMKLRKVDEKEVKATLGFTGPRAMQFSLNASVVTWVILFDGKVEAVFGLGEGPGYGIPWFLASEKFYEFKTSFTRLSTYIIPLMLESYPLLQNLIDSRHKESIKWLRWLGFTIDEVKPYYLYDNKIPFYAFVKRRGE
jgi:hypothetical protein